MWPKTDPASNRKECKNVRLNFSFYRQFSDKIGVSTIGTVDVLRKLLKAEGVTALYTGAVPVLLRKPRLVLSIFLLTVLHSRN